MGNSFRLAMNDRYKMRIGEVSIDDATRDAFEDGARYELIPEFERNGNRRPILIGFVLVKRESTNGSEERSKHVVVSTPNWDREEIKEAVAEAVRTQDGGVR